jgi:hypothetical protein
MGEIAAGADPERAEVMLVAAHAGAARARGNIKVLSRRMRPGILNAATHPDRAAPGQGRRVGVDLIMGEFGPDAGIERRFRVGGLGECEARRRHRAGQQCGKRATIEIHLFLPVIFIGIIRSRTSAA